MNNIDKIINKLLVVLPIGFSAHYGETSKGGIKEVYIKTTDYISREEMFKYDDKFVEVLGSIIYFQEQHYYGDGGGGWKVYIDMNKHKLNKRKETIDKINGHKR